MTPRVGHLRPGTLLRQFFTALRVRQSSLLLRSLTSSRRNTTLGNRLISSTVIGFALFIPLKVNHHLTESPHNFHTQLSGSGFNNRLQRKKIRRVYQRLRDPDFEYGWDHPHQAVMAFYRYYDKQYQTTDEFTELLGYLLKSDTGRYYVTEAMVIPAKFKMFASIRMPAGWRVEGAIHTHPMAPGAQEHFSRDDRDSILRGETENFYLRTPLGDVRHIDKKLAKRTKTFAGARGKSICPDAQRCMAPHLGLANNEQETVGSESQIGG